MAKEKRKKREEGGEDNCRVLSRFVSTHALVLTESIESGRFGYH